jgi:hypothetical protein
MYRTVVVGPVLALFVLVAGCGSAGETPVEEAEEEAGVEEIEPEPEPADIQAEGCPEGQVSNEAGTECYPEEEAERARERMEQMAEDYQREQFKEQIRSYEAGELGHNDIDRLQCQWQRAALDGGIEYADSLLDEAAEQGLDAAAFLESLAERGYGCTPSEDFPAPPTPDPKEFDKKYEQPAPDAKSREVQCGPQSNASPEFREKYC